MYFIGSEPCRGVDGVVVGVLNVREVSVPVVLVFVAYHGQHLRHGVIYAFDSPVTTRVVGARRKLVYTEELVDGYCGLCAELKAVVG